MISHQLDSFLPSFRLVPFSGVWVTGRFKAVTNRFFRLSFSNCRAQLVTNQSVQGVSEVDRGDAWRPRGLSDKQ